MEALTEDEYRRFLVDGYLERRPRLLTADDHRRLYDEAAHLYELARAAESPTAHLDILGDNLRARVPAIDRLLHDPAIDGVLTDLLGADYLIHPHSYCHRAATRDQVFHQDGNLPWNERGHARGHRLDWAMLFYYPQDVDADNGPTEVVPGTQFWTVDHEKADGGWHPGDRLDRRVDDELFTAADLDRRDRALTEALDHGLGVPDLERRFLHVEAGTVVIAHYDLVHRGSRALPGAADRFMYKFYLARVHEPSDPIRWTVGPADGGPTPVEPRPESAPIVQAVRRWADGPSAAPTEPASATDVERWGRLLATGREHERVGAAYRLAGAGAAGRAGDAGDSASIGDAALAVLADGLRAEREATRRAAGIGLRQAGAVGVSAALAGLDSPAATTRRPAVAALASVAADRPDAVASLVRTLAGDPDDLVRSNAAYSLGYLARSAEVDAGPVATALLDRLAPGAEPDNAFGAGFSRSTVRQSAAFGLLQVLANHRLPGPVLAHVVDQLLAESDRYVQGLLIEGLTRAEGIEGRAGARLLRFLADRRFSPSPEHESGEAASPPRSRSS